MIYYRLHINLEPSKAIYEKITELIGLEPMPFRPSKLHPMDTYDDWSYEIQEDEEEEYKDGINALLDLIEPRIIELGKLNVKSDDILIWYFYEYRHQCAMSFDAVELKRLGNLGITLNIDCWEESKDEIEE